MRVVSADGLPPDALAMVPDRQVRCDWAGLPAFKWLTEMGAFRPARVQGFCLVLGRNSEGVWPIEWSVYVDTLMRDFNGKPFSAELVEQWRIFGIPVARSLTKADCHLILRMVK
jgi:hypothetical protein